MSVWLILHMAEEARKNRRPQSGDSCFLWFGIAFFTILFGVGIAANLGWIK